MESDEPRSLSIDRRSFLALAGISSVAACSSADRPVPAQSTGGETSTPMDKSYQISNNYTVGPKRDRPPASEATGTIWEVTPGDGTNTARRTLSDGTRWITLNVKADVVETTQVNDQQYLTPSDGFEAIQRAIDQANGDVVIRLAPGTYTGKGLTLRNGVMLEGAGRHATTIKLEDGANADLVKTADPPQNNVQQCTLRDITFHGNRSNNASGNVVYGAFWNSRFVDCEFKNAPERGFWLAGSEQSTDDNHFRGCYFINNNGTGLRGGANKASYPSAGVIRVDTNWFGYNGGPAIDIKGDSWKILDSKFYGNGQRQNPTINLDQCTFARIAGCDISAVTPNQNLVSVQTAKGVNSVGVQLTDNDFREEYGAAVGCLADGDDIVGLRIAGNTVQSDGNCESGLVANAKNGGEYVNCSAKDNTFVGNFTGSKFALPDSWSLAGNLNVP